MSLGAGKTVPQAHITVSAFDLHLWSKPFDPAHFNSQIHFLWSGAAYPAMRAAGQKVDLGDLILFPLKDEIDPQRNHFWWRYETAIDKLSPLPATPLGDSRAFLWPLRCRPKSFKLLFAASKTGVPLKVWTTIWLWPFGWSSTIEFKIAAPFSLDDLQDLGETLRGAAPAPFVLDGKPLSLSGVFMKLAEMVRRSIGIPGKVPGDITHLNRYSMFSLELPSGQQVPSAGWPASDRSRMLGALRGQKVLPGAFAGGDVLVTPLGSRNFAVTDFNEGTLLVLRHSKDRGAPTTRQTNHCLFANLRSFTLIYFALQRFAQYAKGRADIANAATNAKAILSSLPEEYRNQLSEKFTKHYAP